MQRLAFLDASRWKFVDAWQEVVDGAPGDDQHRAVPMDHRADHEFLDALLTRGGHKRLAQGNHADRSGWIASIAAWLRRSIRRS